MFAGRGRPTRWLRRRRSRDDRGSMPLALLVTLVSVTLSAGLSGLVVGQIQDSRRVADRVAAVNAAQAGLDAGLATIRSAFDTEGGVLAKLPCTSTTGTMSASAGYSTSIGYTT